MKFQVRFLKLKYLVFNSFIHSIDSFVHTIHFIIFIRLFTSFIHSFVHFILSFTSFIPFISLYSFVRWIRSLHSFVRWIHSLHSFVHFIQPIHFLRSFTTFVQSFVHFILFIWGFFRTADFHLDRTLDFIYPLLITSLVLAINCNTIARLIQLNFHIQLVKAL